MKLKILVGFCILGVGGYFGFNYVKKQRPELVGAQPAVRFDQKFDQALKELKIEDLKVGTGAVATRGKKVTVHYEGRLMDGTVFDSSLARKQPISFPLGVAQGLPGWDHGLEGMRVGGKRKLAAPPFLAYGDKGVGTLVPPNSTVQFEFELLNVAEADDKISKMNAQAEAAAKASQAAVQSGQKPTPVKKVAPAKKATASTKTKHR